MSSETRQHEEDEEQARNDNEVLNHPTEGERDTAEENLNNKPEVVKETGTMLGKFKKWVSSLSKKRSSSSKATECMRSVETPSEDLTHKAKEEQGDDIGPEEPKKHKEPKRNSEINAAVEETTQMGHLNAEDKGQLRKDNKEERLQARGEEGDTTVREMKTSEEVKAQENEDSNTRKNSDSAEFKESRL